MLFAALKILTWGTVATAIGSALLLAIADGSMSRLATLTDFASGPPATLSGAATAPAVANPPAGALRSRDAASH